MSVEPTQSDLGATSSVSMCTSLVEGVTNVIREHPDLWVYNNRANNTFSKMKQINMQK